MKPMRNLFSGGGVRIGYSEEHCYYSIQMPRWQSYLPDKKCEQRSQPELTLFFSNFQFSSWARICSTTDMASRPCLTYSFSWGGSDTTTRQHQEEGTSNGAVWTHTHEDTHTRALGMLNDSFSVSRRVGGINRKIDRFLLFFSARKKKLKKNKIVFK